MARKRTDPTPTVPKIRTALDLDTLLALRRAAVGQGKTLGEIHAAAFRAMLEKLAAPSTGRALRVVDPPEDGVRTDLRPGAALVKRARSSALSLDVELRAWAYTAAVCYAKEC